MNLDMEQLNVALKETRAEARDAMTTRQLLEQKAVVLEKAVSSYRIDRRTFTVGQWIIKTDAGRAQLTICNLEKQLGNVLKTDGNLNSEETNLAREVYELEMNSSQMAQQCQVVKTKFKTQMNQLFKPIQKANVVTSQFRIAGMQNRLTMMSVIRVGKLFMCPEKACKRTFKYRGNVRFHLRSVHQDIRPFKCTYGDCKVSFPHKGSLNEHHRRHQGIKSFFCTFENCRKAFLTAIDVKLHSRYHTEESNYKCQVKGCGRAFKSSSNLTTHQLVHTGEKRFQCETCDQRFSTKSHLERHCLVHTGERSFECEDCSKKFMRRDHLKKHKCVRTQ